MSNAQRFLTVKNIAFGLASKFKKKQVNIFKNPFPQAILH